MRPSASALRAELEASLSQRIPRALTPRIRQAPELFPTGMAVVDDMLGGGIPRGGVTEISGSASSGRTALALSVLAQITQQGAACAWVDVHDALDPASAAACGVQLERLLWLRVGGNGSAPVRELRKFAAAQEQNTYPANAYNSGLHPRNEVRGFDRAVSELFGSEVHLRDKTLGTPGAVNRQLFAPRCAEPQPYRRKEQVAADRLPPRRGEWVLNRHQAVATRIANGAQRPGSASRSEKPWSRLEQALRATDLLLQAGGFSSVVLDMSEVQARDAVRVPTATWYRFRLAAEQSQAAILLLTQTPCARSSASLVLRCERAQEAEQWSANADTALFEGVAYQLAIERKRGEDAADPFRKKHVRHVQAAWGTRAQWVR
jgi:recombination protein RecA